MGIPTCIPPRPIARRSAAKLEDLELEVSNYGADFWGILARRQATQTRRKYKDAFKRNLEFCLDIGGDSIRVDTAVGSIAGGRQGRRSRRRYVDDLAGPAAISPPQSEVELYWEFEPGFIINKPSEIATPDRRCRRVRISS